MEHINLRQLGYFEAVYRLGSFSKAAEELSLTHSALTKGIQNLEADWSTVLFVRTTRSITPTEASRRLYPKAVDLLSYAGSIKKKTQQDAREITVVCGSPVLDSWIYPAIVPFRDAFPGVRIVVEHMPANLAVEEILRRRSQLMIYDRKTIEGIAHTQHLEIRTLLRDVFCVVFRRGHPLERGPQDIRALHEYEWAIAGYDPAYEESQPPAVRERLGSLGFPQYRLFSQSACLKLAAATDVLTLVPSSVAETQLDERLFGAMVHPANIDIEMKAAFLQESSEQPYVNEFLDMIRNVKHAGGSALD